MWSIKPIRVDFIPSGQALSLDPGKDCNIQLHGWRVLTMKMVILVTVEQAEEF